MKRRFIWDEWNLPHIAEHGVAAREAEFVVEHREKPFPQYMGNKKYLVRGPTDAGRYLQVIYVFRSADELDIDSLTGEDIMALSEDDSPRPYIIHARDLTDREKRALRRRRR